MHSAADAVIAHAVRSVRRAPGSAGVVAAVLAGDADALAPYFPLLVRGFAAERSESGTWGAVESLPGLARGSRGTALGERAGRLVAEADLLHWRIAESCGRDGAEVRELARAYELCFAGACCLRLGRAGGAPWVPAALDVVLRRLADRATGPAPLPYPAAGPARVAARPAQAPGRTESRTAVCDRPFAYLADLPV